MKRHAKTEVSDGAEIQSAEHTGEQSTDILEEKTAEPEAMEPEPIQASGGLTPAVGGKDRKPIAGSRGLSFRTPPVFRASTNPPNRRVQPDESQNHLRRYRSDPHVHRPGPSPASSRIAGRATPKKSPAEEEDEGPAMSLVASIVLLLISPALVAICAEFLVGSIEHLVASSPLSEAFVGLIILPIVGNAAEHVTAVTVAAKNKLDLALGVSLGSSIQIALFVTPIVVILGWILDKDMSLYFSLFETGSLFVATFIVNFLVLDGRSNYLEGALLCACYIIVA